MGHQQDAAMVVGTVALVRRGHARRRDRDGDAWTEIIFPAPAAELTDAVSTGLSAARSP
jgi:hypothetical protein